MTPRSTPRRFVVALATLAAAFAAPFAGAQTLIVGDAGAPPGTTVAIPIRFESGATVVSGYQIRFSYDRNLVGTPTIAPGAITTCGVNDATGVITALRDTFPPQAIPDETPCTILFPLEAGAAPGTYPLAVFESEFVDFDGLPVPGDTDDGTIAVVPGAGTAPQLGYAPVQDADGNPDFQPELVFTPEVIGATSTTEVVPAAVGGTGSGSVALACTAAGFATITGGGTQTVNPGGTPDAITVQCTPAVASQLGQLICDETDQPGGAIRRRRWDILCAGPLFNQSFE